LKKSGRGMALSNGKPNGAVAGDAGSPPPMLPPASPAGRRFRLQPALALGLVAAAVIWAYWPALESMGAKWWADPKYSHGYMVPIFALVLLALRRERFLDGPLQPCWWGGAFLILGVAMRLAGMYLYFDWLEELSLLPILASVALMMGGWRALRWSWLSITFLFFMIPLPHRVDTALSQPLQQVATDASTYTLQTLGRPAFAEGNIVIIKQYSGEESESAKEHRIGVVEACNGLGMLLLFFAVATGVAVLVKRPLWEKLTIVVTAPLIAVAANIARITVTGLLHEAGKNHTADVFFHDLSGWFMMPLALALLFAELWVLARVFVQRRTVQPLPLTVPIVAETGRQRKKQRQTARVQ
jgi:exosortase